MEQIRHEFKSLLDLLEYLDSLGIKGGQQKDIALSYLGDRAKATDRPITASFELTPLCNFDCKMCYVHLNKNQMNGRELLSVEQWKHIIDMSVEAGIMGADLTGGECLTYPGFKDVYLHLWNKGIQPCVLTNGSLLTDDMVAFFAAHPPKLIQITLYGSSPASYETVTGRDAYHAVMGGIERLKQANLNFRLIITPSRYMQADADALLDKLRALNVRYEVGGVSLPARPDTGRKLEDYEIDATCFARLQKNEIMYRKSLQNGEPPPKKIALKPAKPVYRTGAPCGAAHNYFHINWKGEMCPCISFYQVTCSVLEHSFEEAWLNIRRQMAAFFVHAECRACKFLDQCLSCPAEKCYGKPGMPLNKGVCQRMQAYADVGLLGYATTNECMEVNESHEEGIHNTESV